MHLIGHFPSEDLEVSFCYGQKIKLEVERMSNTALRAEVQDANNTHMVFANEEHEKFYYEKLKQAR